jgi:hypothetical protein
LYSYDFDWDWWPKTRKARSADSIILSFFFWGCHWFLCVFHKIVFETCLPLALVNWGKVLSGVRFRSTSSGIHTSVTEIKRRLMVAARFVLQVCLTYNLFILHNFCSSSIEWLFTTASSTSGVPPAQQCRQEEQQGESECEFVSYIMIPVVHILFIRTIIWIGM